LQQRRFIKDPTKNFLVIAKNDRIYKNLPSQREQLGRPGLEAWTTEKKKI